MDVQPLVEKIRKSVIKIKINQMYLYLTKPQERSGYFVDSFEIICII